MVAEIAVDGERTRGAGRSVVLRRDRRECVMLDEEEVDVADRAPTIRRYAEVAPRELPSGDGPLQMERRLRTADYHAIVRG